MKSPHLDPQWLRAKYVDEGLSTYEIAKIVNRDPKRIYEKLRDFGIPTRPRGENLKGSHNFMQMGKANPFEGKTHSEETRKLLSKKASVPKPYLRGEKNGMFGRTGPSNPRFIDGRSPERQRLYSRAEWKEIRRKVYKRDSNICQSCGKECLGKRSIHIHHIEAWDECPEKRMDIDNLISLCPKCHSKSHSKHSDSNSS